MGYNMAGFKGTVPQPLSGAMPSTSRRYSSAAPWTIAGGASQYGSYASSTRGAYGYPPYRDNNTASSQYRHGALPPTSYGRAFANSVRISGAYNRFPGTPHDVAAPSATGYFPLWSIRWKRLLRGLQLAIRLTPHLTTMGQDPSILTWNGVLQTMVLPRSTTSVSEACPGGARLHEDRVAERRRLEAVEACHFHLLRGTAERLLCLATKSNPCRDLVLGRRRGETSAPAVAAEGLENKNWPEKPWTKLRIYWPR
ncbi:hypothetical protein MRX96_008384 [Rhipicephalus microplus]